MSITEIVYVGHNADGLYKGGEQIERDVLKYIKQHEESDYRQVLEQDDR